MVARSLGSRFLGPLVLLVLGACADAQNSADGLPAELMEADDAFVLEVPDEELAADIDEELEPNAEQDVVLEGEDEVDELGEANADAIDGVEAQSLSLAGGNKTRGLPNKGAGQANKVAAFVAAKCDQEPLLYAPGEATSENVIAHPVKVKNTATGMTDVTAAASLLDAKRALFVQRKPGVRFAQVGGKKVAFVWVDPGLLGYGSSVPKATVDRRFNAASLANRKDGYVVDLADYTKSGRYHEINLRGWMRASCVRVASPSAKGLVKKSYRLPAVGSEATKLALRAGCSINAKYKTNSGSNYGNYAFRYEFQRAIYVGFNTIGATTSKGVGGGGMTSGYLSLGKEFVRTAKFDDKTVNGKSDIRISSSPGADDKEIGVWAYGYQVGSDGKREYGYVYQDCLTAAKTKSGVAASCVGKSEGLYCSGGGDFFACNSKGFLVAGKCAEGMSCTVGKDGKAILDGDIPKCE